MATLPYSAEKYTEWYPAALPIHRGLGRGTRSFSWTAGLAWIGLTFLWALLRSRNL
ncbi:MAG: hypothetical protein HY323_14455 [Betaproteobacteria bacterium]|nr:hypothetical protein [Betaproteobacteria bacterium]